MYQSRRRPWVKLYCREWLTSTVRFDMTELDRSRFIDLLALAGDSKVPGVVCAGLDGDGNVSGYPIDWLASTMRCDIPALQETIKKLVVQDRVTVDGPENLPAIRITSWDKYQSEYLRQTSGSSAQKDERTSGSSAHPSISTSKSRSPSKSVVQDLPAWMPAESWDGFVEMRRATGHPLTKRAAELAVRKLDELRQKRQDPGKVLDQSTLRGWRGLFEVKEDGDGGRAASKTEQRTRHNDAAGKRFLARHGVPLPDKDRG